MPVIWSEGAIADLVRIRSHISGYNPEAANQLAIRLVMIAELLPSNAKMGVVARRLNVRRIIVPQSNYSLIYRLAAGEIEIIEVFDGRRRRPRTDIGR